MRTSDRGIDLHRPRRESEGRSTPGVAGLRTPRRRARLPAGVAVALLLLLLCGSAAGSPDAVSYEQYVTLIHDQTGQGGCVGQSTNHLLEILKEMEAPYTPDPPYGFHSFVFWSATGGGTDPRVPANESMGSYPIMATYGAPPETSFPTNFDVNGREIGDIVAHFPQTRRSRRR